MYFNDNAVLGYVIRIQFSIRQPWKSIIRRNAPYRVIHRPPSRVLVWWGVVLCSKVVQITSRSAA